MGKIIDGSLCRRTCHRVRVTNWRTGKGRWAYFCQGAIGPLTKEQIERYCR